MLTRLRCQSPILSVLAAAALAACEREPSVPPAAADREVREARTVSGVAPDRRPLAAGDEPLPQPTEQPSAAVLGQRLRSAEEAQERGEIVGELWDLATPEAVEILRQRFFIEPDADVKADIVAGLVDEQKPQTREVRFGILSAALAPTQPMEVRETAVAMLVEFDDVRAVALLQNLLSDASEEIREAAREAIDARREKEPR